MDVSGCIMSENFSEMTLNNSILLQLYKVNEVLLLQHGLIATGTWAKYMGFLRFRAVWLGRGSSMGAGFSPMRQEYYCIWGNSF